MSRRERGPECEAVFDPPPPTLESLFFITNGEERNEFPNVSL